MTCLQILSILETTKRKEKVCSNHNLGQEPKIAQENSQKKNIYIYKYSIYVFAYTKEQRNEVYFHWMDIGEETECIKYIRLPTPLPDTLSLQKQ